MIKKLLALPLLMLSLSVSGQIDFGSSAAPIPEEKPYVYDSLMNFPDDYYIPEEYFKSIIGQTVYCVQPAATAHMFSKAGEMGTFFADKVFGQQFRLEDGDDKTLILRNLRDGLKYYAYGGSFNIVFVIEGHFKKMKGLLEGRDFVSSDNRISSLSAFRNPSNYERISVPDGSVWHCDKVYTDTANLQARFIFPHNKGGNVIMSLSNPKHGKTIVYVSDTGLFPISVAEGNLKQVAEKKLSYYIPKKTSPKPAQPRSKSAARRRR